PLPLDRGAVRRGRGDAEDLRLPPPSAARSRHRARAQRDLRRRRHDRVPAARGRQPRPLRAQARPVCVEAGEPVRRERGHRLVSSRTLAAGLAYVGADFRFDPPELHPVGAPSLAVIGTGKRVGKTAVTGHVARLLARDRDVVVVSMGRGGPPEPVVLEAPPTLDDLLALSRAGGHAASDYLETAALAGVTTIGCRRCGGGL